MAFLDNAGVTRLVTDLKDRFAAIAHNHSAADIDSGTLPIARGGTGVTANPSMLTNLGSTTADTVLKASPRPGVTGTLPIANGGTGATTAAGAAVNVVDGQALKPASVAATGEVSAKSGTTTHKLTEKAEDTRADALEASIAYVESTTARTNHAVGDYFMLGGVLMVATAAIATGETISASNASPATLFDYAKENRRKMASLMVANALYTDSLGTINANTSKTVEITLCEDTADYEYRVLGILGIRSKAPTRGTLVVSDYYTVANNISTGKRYVVSVTFRNVTSSAVTCTDKPQIMFVRMTYENK